MGFYSILYLYQSLQKYNSNSLEINYITNGLEKIYASESTASLKSVTKGLLHVIPQENVNIKCRSICVNQNQNAETLCNELISEIDAYNPSSADQIVKDFRSQGYEVILSIGEVEENKIGSNCGQFVTRIQESKILNNH